MIIETVCFLYSTSTADLIGIDSTPETEAKIAIKISEIESVREIQLGDEIRDDRCCVYLKSGESIQIGLSYSDVLFLLKTS
jgi:hypothetical protein